MRDQSKPLSQIFAGPSEMHARVREHDWAATPLGPVASWPQSLTSLVKTLLASRYPMVLTWGPQFIQFYNDAYSRLIGDKHPAALGEDIRVTLEEGWDTLGPLILEVMRSGVANWNPALLLTLERSGYREEAYFDVSHAPAEDDEGQIVGMLAVCSEVTQQVLSQRRLRLLRDLAARAGAARNAVTACHESAACIAMHPLDVPFALIYLREGDQLFLHGAVGMEAGTAASPRSVDLSAHEPAAWPFAQVAAGETVLIDDVQRHARLRGGPWNEPVCQALALPIAAAGETGPRGILIASISPNRALDEGYRSFYELLAGHLSAAVSNARAHEEERQRIAALAQLDRAKTEFFSNVSHEFRTPLTLMLGPLEATLNAAQGSLSAPDREHLEVAYRNALRLLKLVNTLLDFSRIEADRAQASYEPVDLAALTADLASLFRSAIEQAGLAFVVECPPLPEPVYVDREMWEKIVLNLLSNAFKFTQQGRITLRQRLVGEQIELSVADTGAGISAADIDQVFQRFHRIAGTAGRSHEGSGIGLALVQELAALHGGRVHVTSTLGQGSTFTVSIPLGRAHLPAEQIRAGGGDTRAHLDAFVDEALRWLPNADRSAERFGARPAQLPTEPGPELPAQRSRILLADDNADMREYVTKLLGAHYAVVAVPDGEAALQAAREQLPDLILSDIMMPRLDGIGLLAQLRADPSTRTIPVILLSARAGDEARAAGIETGADDYLIKPFAARELLARVQTHLELVRMRREAAEERALRSAAEALVQERDQFLSLAAHELKTPLTSIRGYVDLFVRRARQEDRLSERDERTLEVITRQVGRLNKLIAELLDLSRIQIGQFELARRSLDLGSLIRRVADDVRLVLTRHSLELELPDEPLVIYADELRLEQVLQNLIENAVKYSPYGGRITVSAVRQQPGVCLSVHDQGIGIPESAREQIFQRFYRAHNANQQSVNGLGIGLYVVREIVRHHSGTIDVASQEGVGSTFTVCLPISADHRSIDQDQD
ncbi:MAG TPA: ATP-binding protein [Herpetosiphonaceae bacterium]